MANLLPVVLPVLLTSLISSCSTQSPEPAKPYFIAEPQSVTATEGETVEIRCEAGGEPRPEVQWTYDGEPIRGARTSNPENSLYRKFVIEGVVAEDAGSYGCNFSNALGFVFKDVRLEVSEALPAGDRAPYVYDGYLEKHASPGDNVVLGCAASGVPKPNITWHLLSKELSSDGKYSIDENSGDLAISYVEPGDNRYTCIVSNMYGEARGERRLAVKYPKPPEVPFNFRSPYVRRVKAGEAATFNCTYVKDLSAGVGLVLVSQGGPRGTTQHNNEGNQKLVIVQESAKYDVADKMVTNIAWVKDGKDLDFDGDQRIARSNTNSILVITNTKESDVGTYSCVANLGGRKRVSAVIELYVTT